MFGRDRRVVEDVAGLERVGAVEDDVVAGDEPLDVLGDQHLLVEDDVDLRVERVDRLPGAFDLALPHPIGRVDDLALEVADIDDVEVDDPDRPDTRRGEVQRSRGTETAGADEQRLRAEQLRLAGRADLRDQQVAAVALLLLGGQDDRCLELEPGALPALEPARHRGDVGVAHLGQGLGGEQRADAAGAVQDHRGVTVGRDALDLLLDVGLGDVLGARQVALLPFGRLADVDDGGAGRRRGHRPPGG